MNQINIVGYEAREKAIAGMSYVAKVVKSTIGPFGLNVSIEKQNIITNDGYRIAANLSPAIKNEFERRGAIIAQEASSKTNEQVGDATSTAWALTEAIVKEAVRYLPSDKVIKAKKTPAEIIQMINKAKDEVIAELDKITVPVASKEELIKSALVSVEDEELANMLGEAQWELGGDGIIIAEEVNEVKSSIEKVKGIRLDNGFGTPIVMNNHEKGTLEINDLSILLTNYTMDVKEIKMFHEAIFNPLIAQKKFGVVLVARAFTAEAIKFCMESMKTGFAVFPINAPYVNQREVLHDIEAVVGGRYIDIEESRLEDVHIDDVGFVKRLVARQFDAVITGIETTKTISQTLARLDVLRKKLEGEKSDFGKRMLESRIAQLSNGFGILKVGSASLTNRKRLKDKADDAVSSVRHALKGGTVKGAGQAFKEIADRLPEDNILRRPLTCIYDQITGSAPEGWTIPEWVRDPAIVLKTALINACDVAGTFASINGIVTTKNPPECKQNHDEDNS